MPDRRSWQRKYQHVRPKDGNVRGSLTDEEIARRNVLPTTNPAGGPIVYSLKITLLKMTGVVLTKP